jgi:hypothetical protein
MDILYLFARRWYEHKMSAGRVLYARAVARQPGVKLRFWGPGWPGYRDECTLAENLAALEAQPTHLWFYKAADYQGTADVDLPRLVVFNEAFDRAATWGEIRAAAATHVVFHHENDWRHWEKQLPNTLHLPHAAEPYPAVPRLEERPWDCLVTGRLSRRVYPLRSHLAREVERGALPGMVYPHPGYVLPSHDEVMAQYARYRQTLLQGRLGLSCSSVYRYNLARFAELAMAGTVIVTDEPDDKAFRQHFGAASILVSRWATRWRLRDVVRQALRDPVGLQQRSDELRRVAEARLSMDCYARELVGWWRGG